MKKDEAYHDKLGRIYGTMPLNVTMQVTEDCNLACSYCYQKNKSKNAMTLDVAKKFLDSLLGGKFAKYFKEDYDGFVFDFIGGEPFLQIQLISEICSYILEKLIFEGKDTGKVMFSFSTNGTLYFDEKVQKFLDDFLPFISMSVTLDGDKTLHDACRVFPSGEGSFDLALKAEKDWQTRGGRVGTKLTICHENLPHLCDAVGFMLELGLESIHLNCVYENVWQKGDDTKLYFALKEIGDLMIARFPNAEIAMFDRDRFCPLPETETGNWCGGDGRMIAVDYLGRIFPCIRYMGSSIQNQAPFVIGDIKNGIGKSEVCKARCESLRKITRQSQSEEKCLTCPVATGCGWCTAHNYDECGTPDKRVTYHCDMHKATALANVYYWNKRAEVLKDCAGFKMWLSHDAAEKIVGKAELEKLKELGKNNEET